MQSSSELSEVPKDSQVPFQECEWRSHTSLKVGLRHLKSHYELIMICGLKLTLSIFFFFLFFIFALHNDLLSRHAL
jgi:hypothetical protein